MNKRDLVQEVSTEAGLTKIASERAVSAFTNVITDALARGEKVTLVGFGTFRIVTRKARTGRNPRTGAAIQIPLKDVPKFVAGKTLKKKVR